MYLYVCTHTFIYVYTYICMYIHIIYVYISHKVVRVIDSNRLCLLL